MIDHGLQTVKDLFILDRLSERSCGWRSYPCTCLSASVSVTRDWIGSAGSFNTRRTDLFARLHRHQVNNNRAAVLNNDSLSFRLSRAEMSAIFSQNPLMNGPNYSFNQAPATASAGNKEHGFYPYVVLSIVFLFPS